MRTKKINVKYKPLQASHNITTVGSVAPSQTYLAETNEYDADYTITPLVLLPQCNVTDRDGVITANNINSALTNVKWYETAGGVRTQISSTNGSYEITASGESKGRIKVKKNASVGRPITLEFYGEYVDPRTDQILVFRDSVLVKCINATPPVPVLKLDSPESVAWDPFTDPGNQTIKASLMAGGVDVTGATAKRKFFWYKAGTNGALRLCGSDAWDVEIVSVSDGTLVVNRELTGDAATYVCKASYAASGNPATSPAVNAPCASTTIRRRIPDFEEEVTDIPNGIAPGTTLIYPELVVTTPKGILSNPEKELICKWYTKPSKSGSFVERGHGASPAIPTADAGAGGMIVGAEVTDMGAWCFWTDSDGKVITDSDNKPIIIR